MIALRCDWRKQVHSWYQRCKESRCFMRFDILVKNGDGKQGWSLGQKAKSFVLILNLKRQWYKIEVWRDKGIQIIKHLKKKLKKCLQQQGKRWNTVTIWLTEGDFVIFIFFNWKLLSPTPAILLEVPEVYSGQIFLSSWDSKITASVLWVDGCF